MSASGEEHKFGTVLVLAPKYFPPLLNNPDSDDRLGLWLALAKKFHRLMEVAVYIWETIAKHLRWLLAISNPKGLHIDDKNFSEFQNILWVIDKLHKVLPMVHDSIEQWDLF